MAKVLSRRASRDPGRPGLGGRLAHTAALLLLGSSVVFRVEAQDLSTTALKSLSIEDLANLEVTSVSKTSSALSSAPAAIYVITHEEVVRSGATSLPEVLRLAPNLQVLEISPSNYTITARGFSGNSAAQNFSDKLLVLIDGRSVYTPLYSGVYWDAQDVLLDDIERIEVISGPGATLWGANAVNGVINIVTRRAAVSESEASLSAGNAEKNASAQGVLDVGPHGDGAVRVYAKAFERSAFDLPSGPSADDGWSKTQLGFRGDWASGADAFTLQGDFYGAHERQSGAADGSIAGANVLSRWRRALGDDGSVQLQAYYDETQRFGASGSGAFVLSTYDVEFQHSLTLDGGRHALVWGVDERASRYDITNTATLLFVPPQRTLNLADIFVQDSIALLPRLKLIAGLKAEDDPYSGTTPLPNVRLAWSVSDTQFLWSAVSRAIRSPTPFDRDIQEYLGGTLFLTGGANFKPERLTAYELGYRGQPDARVSLSISTYYNQFDDLRSIEFDPATLIPLHWGNGMEGHTYGLEVWGNWQASSRARLALGFTQAYETLRFKPGSSGLLGVAQAGDDPEHQAHLRAAIDLPRELTFDADLRYVGTLPNPEVHAYEELNARLGWRLTRRLELALSGENLLHAHHQEFTVPPSDAIPRRALFTARTRF